MDIGKGTKRGSLRTGGRQMNMTVGMGGKPGGKKAGKTRWYGGRRLPSCANGMHGMGGKTGKMGGKVLQNIS